MVQIMAHRAGSRFRPNSRESVEKVLTLKPDIIELDVRLSKDNRPVCYHGNLLETLGFYSSTNYKTAKQLSTQGISTLPELAGIIKGKIDVFLDIKDPRISKKQIMASFENVMPSTLHIGARDLTYFKRFGEKPDNVMFCRNFGFRRMPSLDACKRSHIDVLEIVPGLANRKYVNKIHNADLGFAVSPFIELERFVSAAASLGAQWINVYDVQFYRQLLGQTS